MHEPIAYYFDTVFLLSSFSFGFSFNLFVEGSQSVCMTMLEFDCSPRSISCKHF